MAEILLGKRSAFKEGDRRIVQTDRGDVGVFHYQGEFYAYSNTCVHSGGPACEGVMIPKVLDIIAEDRTYQGQTFDENDMHFVCPWHGWEYELKTGKCVSDPRMKLRKYEVVSRGDDVFLIA